MKREPNLKKEIEKKRGKKDERTKIEKNKNMTTLSLILKPCLLPLPS
jgi:hypothetical protein